MQITNSVVCDASKGCIYKQIKSPLVGEHAFQLTGFVCWSANVTLFFYLQMIRPRGFKTFFMLNSAEHEIHPAY